MYKFMIGSDFHFPAQDDRAIDLWFQVMKYWKPEQIDLLGDISDTYEYSRFNLDTHEDFFGKFSHLQKDENKQYNIDELVECVMETEKPARDFIKENRKARKNADIRVWDGNHGWTRIYAYFSKKYPEVLNHITPEEIYGVTDIKAEWLGYQINPVKTHGDIYLHHGNMLGTTAAESIKKHMDSHLVSMITGHHHRIGQYNKTYPLRNEVLKGWENGHMVDINHPYMDYCIAKNWQQGFTIGLVDDDNNAHVQTIHITKDYTCAVNGRIFRAD